MTVSLTSWRIFAAGSVVLLCCSHSCSPSILEREPCWSRCRVDDVWWGWMRRHHRETVWAAKATIQWIQELGGEHCHVLGRSADILRANNCFPQPRLLPGSRSHHYPPTRSWHSSCRYNCGISSYQPGNCDHACIPTGTHIMYCFHADAVVLTCVLWLHALNDINNPMVS